MLRFKKMFIKKTTFLTLILLGSSFCSQNSFAARDLFETSKILYKSLKDPSILKDEKTKGYLWNTFKNTVKDATAFAQGIAISTATSRATFPSYPLAKYFYVALRYPPFLKDKENQTLLYDIFKYEFKLISLLAKDTAKKTTVFLGVHWALAYPIISIATSCCYLTDHCAKKIPHKRLSSLLIKHKYDLVSGSAAIAQLILVTKISAMILKGQASLPNSPLQTVTNLYFLQTYMQSLKNLLPQLEGSFPNSKTMSCFKYLNPFRKLNAYTILSINQNATPEEIRNAYQKRLLESHPDKNPNNKQGAAQRLKEIKEAYTFLSQHKSTDTFWRRLTKNWRRFTHEQTQEPDVASSESIKLLTWQPTA